ncbi:hypothetical protein MRX96_043228 [Rhipicephalus microplus]
MRAREGSHAGGSSGCAVQKRAPKHDAGPSRAEDAINLARSVRGCLRAGTLSSVDAVADALSNHYRHLNAFGTTREGAKTHASASHRRGPPSGCALMAVVFVPFFVRLEHPSSSFFFFLFSAIRHAWRAGRFGAALPAWALERHPVLGIGQKG